MLKAKNVGKHQSVGGKIEQVGIKAGVPGRTQAEGVAWNSDFFFFFFCNNRGLYF